MIPVRCAIYTRKSTEDGLEQDFNSLDAQREACEAFIASQKGEGWLSVADHYDDGGFSGGTMDRPALQNLLAAVRSGEIDVVVVYKVDRLTRSLADFAKIVETFDAHSVSFVSVTQQFNTTTSMGRLTLNVLLSFAQFEREVTGERIRDKIAASKKKGMWMGGTVPLGYDVKDKALIVNNEEARTVEALFQLYLDKGCVREAWAEAAQRGCRTKTGKAFSQGHLYRILQNPLYAGQIRHGDRLYPGLHAAIIDEDIWHQVQEQLSENRVARRSGATAREPSLLAGKLFDQDGRPFTPSHAVKKGRRYRYYMERMPSLPPLTGKRPRRKRLPAAEIEDLVIARIVRLLKSPKHVLAAAQLDASTAAQTRQVVETATALAGEVASDPAVRHSLVRRLVDQVVMDASEIRIDVDGQVLCEALGVPGGTTGHQKHTLHVPASLRMRGVEVCFAIDDPDEVGAPNQDPSLIKAIVRAHDWWRRLLAGEAASLAEIARADGVTDRYVRRILDFAFLDPDITVAILDGRQPVDLTAERLTTEVRLPFSWAEQRQSLGFQ
jgi:DNA invertase Pin-like site-specific DNA recombinase